MNTMTTVDQPLIERIFTKARTAHGFLKRPVDDRLLHEIYEIMKWGPTAANSCPMRIVFVRDGEAKKRLISCLHPDNVQQTTEVPVTAIIGFHTRFYEWIPRLMPAKPELIDDFAGPEKEAIAQAAAFRNSALQGAYFMLAARAVGLDCGPMSAFDPVKLNAEFFPDGEIEVNFLCNLGYGNPGIVLPRAPRFDFEEVCKFA